MFPNPVVKSRALLAKAAQQFSGFPLTCPPGFPAGSLGLFQSVHSEVLPGRARSSQSSFTGGTAGNLCRALSAGNEALPEDRSPERGPALTPDRLTQAGTIFCMENIPPRGLGLPPCLAASPRGVQAPASLHHPRQLLPEQELHPAPRAALEHIQPK